MEEDVSEHKASVFDWCYGFTGGVLCVCSCGARWCLSSQASDSQVERSLRKHERVAVESARRAQKEAGK